MRGHIADDQWIDVVDGVAAPEVRAHLQACAECRATADEVGTGWEMASDADVPEPSPLYWESFRRRVGQAIARESAARPRWPFLALGGALAAASLVVAVSIWMNTTVRPVTTATMATLEAWSPLPAAEDDEALPVLVAVTSGEVDASAAACADVASCIDELSDDEAQGLEDALRQELGGRAL